MLTLFAEFKTIVLTVIKGFKLFWFVANRCFLDYYGNSSLFNVLACVFVCVRVCARRDREWVSKRLLAFQIPCRADILTPLCHTREKARVISAKVLKDLHCSLYLALSVFLMNEVFWFTEPVHQRNAALSSSDEWVRVVFLNPVVLMYRAVKRLYFIFNPLDGRKECWIKWVSDIIVTC